MKKLLLFFGFLFATFFAKAQMKLSGTFYKQNFDTLALGLPQGWRVDTNAKAATVGGSALATFVATPGTTSRWGNTGGAFKNVASANGFASFAAGTNAAQLAATDRALGVKQTGTFGDAGASFSFQIDNTFRLSDFELDFKLQSLDSSAGGRTTTWLVQYAFGDKPSVFTTIDIDSNGGNTFANKLKTVSFGSALDDKRETVWIRIVTLKLTTGAGSRTTTAIDDVELRWTGMAVPSFRPLVKNVFPANAASDVPVGTILSIDFSKNISIGDSGNIYIKNETDNTLQTIATSSVFLNAVGTKLNIEGVQLLPSKMYHLTFDSTIVDTAGATTFALEDTTEWRFSTVSALPNLMFEYFDTACVKSNALPALWRKFSSIGSEEWNCTEHATGNASIRMYGHNGTVNTENKDWLISPRLSLSSPDFVAINIHLFKANSGDELSILVSNDYAGSGSPDSATWSPIAVPMSASATNKWRVYNVPMTGHTSSPVHLAFQYNSTSSAGYEMMLDSVITLVKTNIIEQQKSKNKIRVVGYPNNNYLQLEVNAEQSGFQNVSLLNLIGQKLSQQSIWLNEGKQIITLEFDNLPTGMYVVEREQNGAIEWVKCMIP